MVIATLKKIWNNDKTRYLIADMISKGSNYLLLLFFSYVLTVEEYGELSLYYSLVTLFLVVLSLNMTRGYITRAYYDDTIDFKQLMGAITVFLLAINGLFLIVSAVLFFQHTHYFDLSTTLIASSIVTAVSTQFVDLQNSMFNAKRDTQRYFYWSTAISLVLFGGSVGFYYWFNELGLYSLVVSKIIISLIASIVILITFRREFSFRYNKAIIRNVLTFSLPLVMHSISGFILNYISRFMLNSMNGLYDAGIYSFAYNFSMFVFIAAVALNNAWTPQFYKLLKEENYSTIEKRVRHNFILFAYLVLGFSLFSKEAMEILFSDEYRDSINLIYLLNINYLIFYAYTLFSNYIFYYKKTMFTFINTTIVGIVTILLNLWLIPKFGYNGAAFTTIISFALLFAMYYVTVSKWFKFTTFRISVLILPFIATCAVISLLVLLDGHTFFLYALKVLIVCAVAWDVVRRFRK